MKKGSTEACWKHFIAHLNKDLIPHLAAIAKVGIPTVKRWIRQEKLPLGTELLAVRHFLSYIGYEVKELKDFDGNLIRISLLVTFGPFTVKEIAGHATYPGKDHLLRVFRGVSINEARTKILLELCHEYEEEVTKKQSELIQKVRAIARPSDEAALQLLGLEKEIVETAAATVRATYKALEPFVGNESTRHDRELLRKEARK